MRSKISSKLIFASCVLYSDRAHYELCVLIKDIGRRLPLQLQCSYQGQQDDFSQSVRGNYKTRFYNECRTSLRLRPEWYLCVRTYRTLFVVQVGASTYEQHSRSSCMIAGHRLVRARSTAARLRSCARINLFEYARTSARTAGTVLPAPPFAFVFAWRSHTTLLAPRICPRHPYWKSPNTLGLLNCAQAKHYKLRRTYGLPTTCAEFMAATCMSARQRRSAVGGLRGRNGQFYKASPLSQSLHLRASSNHCN